MSANAKFVSLDWKLQHFFTPKFAKIIVLASKSFSRTDFNSLLYGKRNCLYILQQILIMLTWKWGEIISWQMSHCHNVNVSSHLSSCSHSSMTWQWITLRQEIILNITQHTAYFKHRTMHLQSLHVHKCVHVSSDLTCKLESLSVKHKIYIDKFYQRTKRT